MPLKPQKPTVRGAVQDVLLAPFVFVFAAAYTFRWILLFGVGCMALCRLFGADMSGLTPRRETVFSLIGSFALVAIAAIPLAIRDYFSGTGGGLVWEPDESCLTAIRGYAGMILTRDYGSLRKHLHPWITETTSPEEVIAAIDSATAGEPAPVAVHEVQEIPIPVETVSGIEDVDTIARVVLESSDHVPRVLLDFQLLSTAQYQIVAWRFARISQPGDAIASEGQGT
jgi:hypothetical protein